MPCLREWLWKPGEGIEVKIIFAECRLGLQSLSLFQNVKKSRLLVLRGFAPVFDQ